jgi:hypothetical protein
MRNGGAEKTGLVKSTAKTRFWPKQPTSALGRAIMGENGGELAYCGGPLSPIFMAESH